MADDAVRQSESRAAGHRPPPCRNAHDLYGLNPRPDILRRAGGSVRSAKEDDIPTSQTLLLDIDLTGTPTPERQRDLVRLLRTADEYFTSMGVARPVRASTGRGSHLLFAYPPILVNDYPDVRERLRAFKGAFHRAHQQDLNRLEAKIDNTQDLRRMVRVYGTSKPTVGIISKFYGKERVPDHALRDYLLRLTVAAKAPVALIKDFTISDRIPEWFNAMLRADAVLNALWNGKGKPSGTDQTNSGYDFSIACKLIENGITDYDALATIIALRPTGAKGRACKGIDYVHRTVTIARARYQPD